MRFRQRHVQRTIVEMLRAELTALGWIDEPVNFGAAPLQLVEDISVHDHPDGLTPNLMAITIEDEGGDEHQQLGGGLLAVTYSLFVDVYGESLNITKRILSDTKEVLTDRAQRVLDFTSETPVQSDEMMEFEVIAIEAPSRGPGGELEVRRRWRVMTVFVTVTFPGGV